MANQPLKPIKLFSAKKRREIAFPIIEKLKQLYPEGICSLEYSAPFQLLVATRLSAQCTDARVNLVTPELFAKFPTPESLADVNPEEVMPIIRSCGLYKTKARDIVSMAGMLIDKFNGEVPDSMEALLSLPGVGRKIANLVLGDVFGKPAIVTDTHCIRICGRFGLSAGTDPYKVEMQLKEILPPEESNDFCHRLVLFGREFCTARSPKCGICPAEPLCLKIGVA